MVERLAISERAARLAEEKAFALATVNSQNALLHASGHDSRQVILALNSAIDVLKRNDGVHDDLTDMLQSSADYLGEIVSTTISGANIAGSEADFVALASFRGQALIEPLVMMFKAPFAAKNLVLTARVVGDVTIVSDKPLLMRALANLLGNSYQYTRTGGADLTLAIEGGRAIMTLTDSGIGMSEDLVRALNDDDTVRRRGDEGIEGTGSGFQSAKRVIQALGGSLEIAGSGPAGTEVRIGLPCAFATVTPCPPERLRAALPDWQLVDFDQREAFDAALAAKTTARGRIAAFSYDDTTITRGRLSDLVGMMLIKPLCCEMLDHPRLRALSKQL